MFCVSKTSSLRSAWRTLPSYPHRISVARPRCFSRNFSQSSSEKPFADGLRYPPVLGSLIFTIGVSGGVLCAAAYATNRDTERWANSLMSTSMWARLTGIPSSEDLRRARHTQLVVRLRTGLEKARVWFDKYPNYVTSMIVHTYAMLAQKWANSAEGRRVSRTIIALNTAIWLAWQLPRLQPMMAKHFMHFPLSGLSYTLLTCVFSHKGLLHLVCNSFALSGFGSSALVYLATRQDRDSGNLLESTTRYHFLSFFVSAGLFSSFLSHLVRARFYYPRIVGQLSTTGTAAAPLAPGALVSAGAQTAASVPAILPSLGASGAIWACISLTALAFPDARLAFIIPAPLAIPIQSGVFGLVALDVIGIIRGWRFFDHWAHLGGAMFGVFYYYYGPHIWEQARLHTRPPQLQLT